MPSVQMQLVVENLTVRRSERTILSRLSFVAPAGEALLLTGPNGSGKTTLIRAIAGFLPHQAGTLRLESQDPELSLAEQCHYVGHSSALKPGLTVLENVAFWSDFLAADASGWLPGRRGAALDTFGLLELSHVPSAYLSDGQRRRLSLARLLLTYRPLWLLDEPSTSLDAASQGILDAVIDRHLRSGGLALIATHQPLDIGPQRELALGRGGDEE